MPVPSTGMTAWKGRESSVGDGSTAWRFAHGLSAFVLHDHAEADGRHGCTLAMDFVVALLFYQAVVRLRSAIFTKAWKCMHRWFPQPRRNRSLNRAGSRPRAWISVQLACHRVR
jgi:hypothetical protein